MITSKRLRMMYAVEGEEVKGDMKRQSVKENVKSLEERVINTPLSLPVSTVGFVPSTPSLDNQILYRPVDSAKIQHPKHILFDNAKQSENFCLVL